MGHRQFIVNSTPVFNKYKYKYKLAKELRGAYYKLADALKTDCKRSRTVAVQLIKTALQKSSVDVTNV